MTNTPTTNTPPTTQGPLAGIRVLAMTHAWLGTFCAELMALNGAEVIQVESRRRPDAWRGGYDGIYAGAVPPTPGLRPWNVRSLYNAANLNKHGITLDLQQPEGKELFLHLASISDVVAENFSPRVTKNLGISYEDLIQVRPDLVMISLSAYGGSGPWRDRLGIGGTLEPSSGMSELLGYHDGPPMNSGQMLPDPVGGYYGFAALVTALHHRERTGEGQHIDLSMQEANHTLIGDASLEWAVNGTVRGRLGNRHSTFAPHGVYPARGDEQWVALAAESEDQWHALCEVAGHPEWADDPRFADRAARKANEDDLDRLLTAWITDESRDEVVARLAARGLPVAPVLEGTEVAADPVFRERGVVEPVTHPEAGTWPQAGIPYHYSRTPIRVTSAAPMLGQHSAEVFERYCGVTAEQFQELEHKVITGEGPPPEWKPAHQVNT